MSNRESSLQEALVASFQNQASNLFTSIPCIVVEVINNLEGQMVSIQPTINQRLKDDTIKERPVILGVPVVFPASSTAAFTFPIKVGDTGLAVFSMRSLDAWKSSSGGVTTPLNFAKMDKSDAIFIPGLQPPSVSINNPSKRTWGHDTDDAVLVNNIGTQNEVEVRLRVDGGIVINTNQDAEINCNNATVTATADISLSGANIDIDATTSLNISAPTATIAIGTTSWTGGISQSGDYTGIGVQTFNGVIFSSHVHGASPGPSNP